MSEGASVSGWAVFGAGLLTVCGIGLLRFVRRRWYGPYRQWAVEGSGPIIVYIVPGIGISMIGIGVALVSPQALASVLVWGALGFFAVATFSSTLSPKWWGPRWYHQVQRELVTPDQQAWQSLDVAVPAPGTGLGSKELAAAMFDGEPPAARWDGHLVEEPNLGLRKYGVRQIIERAGSIEVRPRGVVFVPSWFTERVSGPHVVPVAAAEIRRIWVVPPGADPDGVVPPGVRTGFFHRVVLETDRGTLLYVLRDAHKRARVIAEVVGCPLVT